MNSGPNSLLGKTLAIGQHTVKVIEKIGEGGYAWVYRAVDAQNKEYALKYVNCLTPDRYEQFMQEANVLKSLPDFPFIVKLYDVSTDKSKYIINFLFELCPQTAIGILSKRSLTREEILIFFHAICAATDFLHSHKPLILHRDLKPENLLVSSDGIPCLCDFGSATTKIYTLKESSQLDEAGDDIQRNTTPSYRAPEMIDLYKRQTIGPAADVWALGCTLYKLVVKQDLYKPEDRLPILQGKLNLPSDIDKDFGNLIKMCIQVDPARRPTAKRLTEIALMLRGDKDKIAIPPPQPKVVPTVAAQAPGHHQQQDIGSGWISSMKDKVRSFVSTGSDQWAIKATFGDSNPPASSYVRKLVIGSIRRTDVDVLRMIEFLFTQRPWQEDARVAAKILYLVLLLAQYQGDLKPLVPVTVKSDQVMAYFSTKENDPTMKGAIAVINGLGILLRTKLMFHAAHPELQGNLAVTKDKTSEQVAADAVKYAKSVTDATKQLLKDARMAKDFSAIVMCQPAIEEILYAAKLAKKLNPDSCGDVLKEIGVVLDQAKGLPYLVSAIDYPEDIQEPGVPVPRFVVSQ